MKNRFAVPVFVLAATLWLAPFDARAQAPANLRGARGVRATVPVANDSPTTQGHLDATQADLNRALNALRRATTADSAISNYGGHLPDATNDVQQALANVAEAARFVAAHPEINPLAPGSVMETLPVQPAVLQAASRVPGLNMLTAIDSLNSALADLANNPGNRPGGFVLGDIGGYRTKIVADLQQALTDVLACIDYSNQMLAPARRGGPASRGVVNRGNQRGTTQAPVIQTTTQSHLDATQYYLEQALGTLHSAAAGKFGGHTELAIAAVEHTQADLAEAVAYVKAHPESNPLQNNPAWSPEPSPVRPILTSIAGFAQMQRSLTSLNSSLGPLLNTTSSYTLGDIGGYRAKLLDDIGQAVKEVQAGLDYANSARGQPN